MSCNVLLLLDDQDVIQGCTSSSAAWMQRGCATWKGQPALQCIHPDDRANWEAMRQATREGLEPGCACVRFRLDTGEWVPLVVDCALTDPTPGRRGLTSIVLWDSMSPTQLDQFQVALDQSPAAVIMTDQDGRIHYVNRRFSEMSGYSLYEVLGQTPRVLQSGLTPPETYRALWTAIRDQQTWRGDLCNRRKDGGLYWHSTSISPLSDSSGRLTGFVAVQEDVTERRRTHEALAAKEAQYRRIVDTATEGIWEVDAGHITTFVNDRLASMLGYTVEEMLGRPVYDFTDEEGQAIARESYCRRREGIREQQDFKLRRRDGSALWVLMSTGPILSPTGEYLGAMAMVTDVSARREAEANLRQSEAWFRTLLEGVEDLIAVMAPDGTFRYASPAFERLLGYPPAALIGKRASSFAHPEETEAVRASFAQALKEPMGRAHFHYRFRHTDGSWRLLEGVGQNLIHDPVIGGVVIHGRDITERTTLEQQYRHAQKMEAVGRLVGGVAHDFNNLLAVILGESALLRDTLPMGHPGLQDLGEIRAAGERAADLTRQLLTFSRQQPMVPRLVELNESVSHMENMLRRLLGEDIRLEVWRADSATCIRTDPGQLEQILLNLAINSRDAMPGGGRLAIGIEQVELDEQYLQRHAISCGAGHYARITVTDTGCGMDEETRSRVFEPFFTTKAPGKGTGLGLSTVYGIVKQNEGFVWVYSEPGLGTSFKVYLPIATPTAEDMTRVAEPDAIPSGTETILVAEDDASVRSYVVRALERQGYTVLAGSDLDVLALARASTGQVDLLLSDVVMPNLRGPDLARQIRELNPDLKVLFMSGYPGHATEQMQLPDAVPYIQKPFAPGALGRMVRQALDSDLKPSPHLVAVS